MVTVQFRIRDLIGAWNVPITRELRAANASAAAEAAASLGYPVALKVDSSDISHKAAAGAVRLGLAGAEAVRAAYGEVLTAAAAHSPHASLAGALVQEMVGEARSSWACLTITSLGRCFLSSMGPRVR